MKKKEVWALLRFDKQEAWALRDSLSIKGVYDTAEAAHTALTKIREVAVPDTLYEVVKTRRYAEVDDSAGKAVSSWRVQGYELPEAADASPVHSKQMLELLLQHLSSHEDKKLLPQLLGQIAGILVADTLKATAAKNSDFDLITPQGQRVEVKAILLDPEKKRAPLIRLNSISKFDLLAVVVFAPDLRPVRMCALPAKAIQALYPHETEPFQLRVTAELTASGIARDLLAS